MTKSQCPLWITLAFTCLVMASLAQNVAIEFTYSTDNTSTLILTAPNLTAADRDAVSYSYEMDAGGAISGASASLYSDGSTTGNSDDISGLFGVVGR